MDGVGKFQLIAMQALLACARRLQASQKTMTRLQQGKERTTRGVPVSVISVPSIHMAMVWAGYGQHAAHVSVRLAAK